MSSGFFGIKAGHWRNTVNPMGRVSRLLFSEPASFVPASGHGWEKERMILDVVTACGWRAH